MTERRDDRRRELERALEESPDDLALRKRFERLLVTSGDEAGLLDHLWTRLVCARRWEDMDRDPEAARYDWRSCADCQDRVRFVSDPEQAERALEKTPRLAVRDWQIDRFLDLIMTAVRSGEVTGDRLKCLVQADRDQLLQDYHDWLREHPAPAGRLSHERGTAIRVGDRSAAAQREEAELRWHGVDRSMTGKLIEDGRIDYIAMEDGRAAETGSVMTPGALFELVSAWLAGEDLHRIRVSRRRYRTDGHDADA